jgi:homopolymeric O-antigen transport system permease protein
VVIQLIFTMALAYILAAINVTFRDLQHIVSNLLTMWFFCTPVLFRLTSIQDERLRTLVATLNPMVSLITSYQAIFYEHRLPDAAPLFGVGVFSVLLMWCASMIFEARREEFAESI